MAFFLVVFEGQRAPETVRKLEELQTQNRICQLTADTLLVQTNDPGTDFAESMGIGDGKTVGLVFELGTRYGGFYYPRVSEWVRKWRNE